MRRMKGHKRLGKLFWLGLLLGILAALAPIIFFATPLYVDSSVSIDKPTGAYAGGIVLVTSTSIAGGIRFHGNLTVSGIPPCCGITGPGSYGFNLYVSTEAQFQAWDQLRGGVPQHEYEADRNYNYYGKPGELNFPIDLTANSTSKYYFLFDAAPAVSADALNLHLSQTIPNTLEEYGIAAASGIASLASFSLNEYGWRKRRKHVKKAGN